MPNANTFDILPINKLIRKYNNVNYLSVDPFANKNKLAKITNDIDLQYDTTYHLDALQFLNIFPENCVDILFFDPPYSPRQVSEIYKKMNKTVNIQTTQSTFWSNLKDSIAKIVKPNGIVISFGWNTNGMGKKRNFTIIEILIVAHGGQHNDTLCTVEQKNNVIF